MRVISLGWGVQSFTLAAMVALGELPPVDAAIHADTGHESALTYSFAEKWTDWLQKKSVPVVTVKNNQQVLQVLSSGKYVVDIPAFTRSEKSDGQITRQCTFGWKIANIRRWLQSNRNKKRVHMLLGISWDESQRMKPSGVQYVINEWPLIDLRMTRTDCVKWLERHNLEIPEKSACTFCPYHSTSEWRRIKEIPQDWNEAVEIDKAIRNARPPFALFVHPSRKPLEDVDFRTDQQKGQLSLWDDECSGICGV